MEIQKKEIIIKPKRKKMDDSKNGDYFLFCRNKKCNQPIYKNRSHFDTRYCDECCQKGNMTDKVDTLIWFYDDRGQVKNLKLGKFLNSINKRINLCNSAQEFFATKKLALNNKTRIYWKNKEKNLPQEDGECP